METYHHPFEEDEAPDEATSKSNPLTIGQLSRKFQPAFLKAKSDNGNLDDKAIESWNATITIDALKQRWPQEAIEAFSPSPVEVLTNPKHEESPSLYSLKDIKAIERTYDFIVWKKEFEKLPLWLEQVEIHLNPEVRGLPLKELVEAVCSHFNKRDWKGFEYIDLEGSSPMHREATPTSDSSFLRRITVNYLRHKATNYDEVRREIQENRNWHRSLKNIAYKGVWEKFCDALIQAFPDLREECEHQRESRQLE